MVKKFIARFGQKVSTSLLTIAQIEHILISQGLKMSNLGGDHMKLPIVEAERIKHGLSRDEFARTLGVSRRTIQNWQSGATEIPLSKVLELTNMWGCSADYLLGLTTQGST